MSMDGLAIRALVAELAGLRGGRIVRVYQPDETDLVLHIRTAEETVRLLLSAHPSLPRIHPLSRGQPANPPEPPAFCMFMRKHCEGAVVEAIRQVGAERIVHIDLRGRDELGDAVTRRIIVELMGRHSNIILVDPASGVVLDAIRRVTPAVSRYRTVLPGSVYVDPPEQRKVDPFHSAEEELVRRLETVDESFPPERKLTETIAGVGPVSAREIAHRAGPNASARDLVAALLDGVRSIAESKAEPNIVVLPDGKPIFSVLRITYVQGDQRFFTTMGECLEQYYGKRAEADRARRAAEELLRFVRKERQKTEEKLAKLRQSLLEAEEAERFRLYGELLTASLHLIPKGAQSFEAVNYYEESLPIIDIPLDPALSPSENAQRYFKKYNKAKNSLPLLREQIRRAEEEQAYLETLEYQLENATPQDLDEIREELIEQGRLKPKATGRPAKRAVRRESAPETFVSSEGATIWVGKNNRQNDDLTTRLAKPGDIWLHAKDMPGSHVVVRGGRFGEQTLLEAAALAAYFSKGRHSGRVPVDYTDIRYVRKPNGAKPGFVVYDHHRTIYAVADESLVRKLARPRDQANPESGGLRR